MCNLYAHLFLIPIFSTYLHVSIRTLHMKASVDHSKNFQCFQWTEKKFDKMINESVVRQNDTELWHSSQLINLGLDRLYNVGALCLFVFYSQCIMRHPFIINNAQSKYYTYGLTKRPQQKYSNLFLVTGAFWVTLCSKRSLWPKLHIACMIQKYLQSLNLFRLQMFLNWLWYANNEPYT